MRKLESKTLVMVVFFYLLQTQAAVSMDAITPSTKLRPPAAVAYHGLRDIPLDLWTQAFTPGADEGFKSAEFLKKAILEAFKSSSTTVEFYKILISQKLNRPFASAEGYRVLAQALFDARRELRPAQRANGALDPKFSTKSHAVRSVLLLEVLAEETLYAGAVRFGTQFPSGATRIWSTVYEQGTPELCQNRTAKLNEIQLCQGDVLLSKGGALSSSFLARVTAYPGNFSHSTTAYVYPGTSTLRLPEAEMEDGVKLRNPKKDYVDSRKRKLFVYRLRATTAALRTQKIAAFIGGVDAYKAEMDRLTNNKAETETSFPYDYSFDGENKEKNFCSSVAYQIGLLGGAQGSWNPYPRALWSTIFQKSSEREIMDDFFLKGLGIPNFVFPAPSDVELNPNYELVAFEIDTSKLAQDRIDVAILDTLFTYLNTNASLMRKTYLAFAKDIGNRPINEEDIERIKSLGVIEDKYLDVVLAKVPDGANLKQVLFFGLMNEVLGKYEPGKPPTSLRAQLFVAHDKIVADTLKPLGLIEVRNLVLKYVDAASKERGDSRSLIEQKLVGFVTKIKSVLDRTAAPPQP